MSSQKSSQLTREEQDCLNRKVLEIARLDVSKIRVENVRALLGGSMIEASDICDLLTEEGVFTKHYEYCCPKCNVEIYNCNYDLPLGQREQTAVCHICEFENPDEAEYSIHECSRNKFYRFTG